MSEYTKQSENLDVSSLNDERISFLMQLHPADREITTKALTPGGRTYLESYMRDYHQLIPAMAKLDNLQRKIAHARFEEFQKTGIKKKDIAPMTTVSAEAYKRLQSLVKVGFGTTEDAFLAEEMMRDAEVAKIDQRRERYGKEFGVGTKYRYVYESQGALLFPDGSFQQFFSFPDFPQAENGVIDLLRADKGVEEMRASNIISCVAGEAHIGDVTLLFHAMSPYLKNLPSLLGYALKTTIEHGQPIEDLQLLRLHTQNILRGYREDALQFFDEIGIHPDVQYNATLGSGTIVVK